MIVFDFIYFSIYSFVPNKAIFGKRDVACTLYSSYSSFLILGLWALLEYLFEYKPVNAKIYTAIVCVIIFGGLWFLIRKIYLKPAKFRSMHRRFRKIPKWLLKLISVLYMLFCFVALAFILTKLSIIKNT